MTQEQGSHRCGLCNKAFDRRDLRDRHRRRCIHTFAKPRKSKRKSCLSCAASKLSCDIGQPSCSRCTSRNVDCQYAPESIVSARASEASVSHERRNDQPSMSVSPAQPSELLLRRNTADGLSPPQELNSASKPGDRTQSVADFQPGIPLGFSPDFTASEYDAYLLRNLHLPSPHPSVDGSLIATDSNPSSNRDFQATISPSIVTDVDGSMGNVNNDALSAWGQVPTIPTSSASSEMDFEGTEFQTHWSDSISSLDSTSQSGWVRDIFQTPMDLPTSFDLLGSFGIPGRRNTTGISQTSRPGSMGQSTFSTVSWKPPLAFNSISNRSSIPATELNPVTMPTRAIATEPQPNREVTAPKRRTPQTNGQKSLLQGSEKENRAACPFLRLGTTDDLIRIACGYPQTMLKRGHYPPFVHHMIYRCAEGDVLEPLANAFCCVSAYNAALPSSEQFVQSLMNQERDRLIKTFRPSDGSDIETLASVHAMCIYQIVGFFMSSRLDSVRAAELQHPFFLKMTRRLIVSHGPHNLTSPVDLSSANNAPDTVWRKWIVLETLRRTIFLVHIINLLSCRAEKQDPYYYENLDDELVLNLPLPAADRLWNASSAEEWRIANAQIDSQYVWEGYSVKTLLDSIAIANAVGGPRVGGGDGGEGNSRGLRASIDIPKPELENLPDFTKFLIACLKDKK